ncbi:hypothetical protein GCM10027562_38410 [Arthrobacter pigmenti]
MCEPKNELRVTDKNSSGCSCCGTGADSTASADSTVIAGTGSVRLQVQGMTCGHCVSSVTEELEEVDGVTNVSVDLVPSGTSTVTVDADSSLDSTLLSAAIADAGYEVVAS